MDDVKLKKDPPAPPLLPVTISAIDKRKKSPPPLPRFPGLHMAGWRALYTACAFAVFAAYATILLITPCADRRPTWWWQWCGCGCPELDGAVAARARAVLPLFLWCATLQAAAAALTLLIPGRRRSRWALAFVAYAATASNHLRFATLIGLVVDTACAVDLVGVLWVIAGGLYLFGAPMFAMLSLGALVTEYLEECHHVMLHDVRYY